MHALEHPRTSAAMKAPPFDLNAYCGIAAINDTNMVYVSTKDPVLYRSKSGVCQNSDHSWIWTFRLGSVAHQVKGQSSSRAMRPMHPWRGFQEKKRGWEMMGGEKENITEWEVKMVNKCELIGHFQAFKMVKGDKNGQYLYYQDW